MIMCMKGHNGICPCHMCNIQGICIPSSWITTHYVPLNCDHFSGINPGYQAHSLPLWNHDTFLKQAVEVKTALTTTASEQLATKYGIKGLPLLTSLTSLSFPLSFPYNFMHLIWSGLISSSIWFTCGLQSSRVLTMMIKIMYWCLQYGRQLVRQHTMLVKQFLQYLALGFPI